MEKMKRLLQKISLSKRTDRGVETMEMIRLEHVTKSFGEHTVLDDFSISIPEGEFLTVIGVLAAERLRC